jgi:glycosyltransferase involved in cell wall biosynthesis
MGELTSQIATINILIISESSSAGGAAIATNRIFKCLSLGNFKVNWIVANKSNDSDQNLLELKNFKKKTASFFSKIDWRICRLIEPDNIELQTAGFFGALSARFINNQNFDVINLHWVGHGLISLRQISKIKKPIIWNMHDEWMLHGISHYKEKKLGNAARNYLRIKGSSKIMERRLKLKNKILSKENVFIVCPSEQLAVKFRAKFPKKINEILFIHNPLNINEFYPAPTPSLSILDTASIRYPVVLYLGGSRNFRKGWDILEKALDITEIPLTLVMVGNCDREYLGRREQVQVITLKKIYDIGVLRNLYSLARVVIIPSISEAGGPQTAAESLSCGTPVIGFRTGALPELIVPGLTGELAEEFDPNSINICIHKVLDKPKDFYIDICRLSAQENFSFRKILVQYESLIHTIVKARFK